MLKKEKKKKGVNLTICEEDVCAKAIRTMKEIKV
jgi:hypothetical protein